MHYWSSTSYADSTYAVYVVSMADGDVSNGIKTSTNHVWPVRAGQ